MFCGGKLYTDDGNISSPGYPEKYENDIYCVWEISVSIEKYVEVVFRDIDIEGSKHCSFDYIEVYYNSMNR